MGSGWCAFRSFLVCISLCLAQALASTASSEYLTPGFRPPSVPLVVIDPYISVWSSANALYDETPQHWSTPPITLSGMISIDKKVHRFMSEDLWKLPWSTMDQVDLKVYPTQTKYSFVKDGVQLNLTFSTPSYAIPGQLPYLPLTYLTYDVASIDGKSHQVQLYYDNSGEGTVNDIENFVQWSRVKMDGNVAMRIGSQKQTALNEGSNRINWGYWYVVVPSDPGLSTSMTSINEARRGFMNVVNGSVLPQDDMSGARACFDNWPGLAVKWDLGVVQPNQLVSKHLTIIYDQIQSINYFGTPMIPYWRHLYENVETLVAKTNYTDIKQMCETLDANVTSQFYKVGGANYTTIASLAWRQAVGATVTVWNDVTQEVWLFMEEISSDGDVSTVDVVFPASPFFLWWDYNSIQLLLKPILEYAINNTDQYGLSIPYDLPWAPHHLGHWPVCNLHPQDQEQMPVEESGNMLLMIAASVMRDPSHDISWLTPYWDVLITWGDYIVDSLPDPGDQLCTDDFEGKSPHNVNLAAKGILGLGGLSYLLRLNAGSNARYIANKYDVLNSEFLAFWLNRSLDDKHSDWHYRLQFDEPGTWSLKYNLLYQKILNLTIFPKDDIDKELEYYMTKMDTYGIPLDDRANYTKADWLMWTAALGNEDQFNAITDMVYKFAHETDGRHPFPDWYKTDTADILGNFYARPVMGGVYSKLLLHSMYGAKL